MWGCRALELCESPCRPRSNAVSSLLSFLFASWGFIFCQSSILFEWLSNALCRWQKWQSGGAWSHRKCYWDLRWLIQTCGRVWKTILGALSFLKLKGPLSRPWETARKPPNNVPVHKLWLKIRKLYVVFVIPSPVLKPSSIILDLILLGTTAALFSTCGHLPGWELEIRQNLELEGTRIKIMPSEITDRMSNCRTIL